MTESQMAKIVFLTVLSALLPATLSLPSDCRRHCFPGTACWPTVNQIADFRNSLDGRLLMASDLDYQSHVTMFNIRVTKYPYFIVMATTTKDVQNAILFARAHHIKLSVRSSGHDFVGRSTSEGSLQINFHNMTGMNVNLNSTRHPTGEITLESGATWIRAYKEVDKYGRVILGANYNSVSMGGFTLGGGTGTFSRLFGLAVDNLLEAELVTSDGRIVTTNAQRTRITDVTGRTTVSANKDLFWALRGGGGGTFGVVTKFTFKLHQAPQSLVSVVCFAPPTVGHNISRLEMVKRFNGLLTTTLAPEWGGLEWFWPSSAKRQTTTSQVSNLILALVHFGPWGSSSFDTIKPWIDQFGSYCRFQNVSTYLETMKGRRSDDSTRTYTANILLQKHHLRDDLYTLLQNFTSNVGSACYGAFYGGNMAMSSSGETSISSNFRSAVLGVTCSLTWQGDGSKEDFYVNKMESFTKTFLTFGNGSYVNEASAFLPQWKSAYWGDNYGKLLAVKTLWDPDNVLSCHHCVGSDLGSLKPIPGPSIIIG